MEQVSPLAGDDRADAFTRLVTPLLGRLTAFARRRLTSADDADDVVQDACVRAWQGYAALRDADRGTAWMFRILRSVMADDYAKRQRRRALVSISRLEDVYERLMVSPDNPHADLLARLTLERIEDALGRIPEDFAAVIELHDVDGLRYAEIAEALGIPIGTVMSRLSRGRKLVAALLLEPSAAQADEDSRNAPVEVRAPARARYPRMETNDG